MTNEPATWHKSSRSVNTNACVEIGRTADGTAVRDSKDRAGSYLTASADQWRLFLTAIKTDRFS